MASEAFTADSAHVARIRPAVNFNSRRNVAGPDILLLHYTGMNGGKAAEDWLCCQESCVSCHYIIHENGEIVQMVREGARAFHAGEGTWEGRGDVNSRSIGIEIVNDGHGEDGSLPPPFLKAQMKAVARLAADIIVRHAIAPFRVLAHSDTAPGRKIDPGEGFDWNYLAGEGIGWVAEPDPKSLENIAEALVEYGYGVGATAENLAAAITAFQRHFRPSKVDGLVDHETSQALASLLARRRAHQGLAGYG
jgi:N-acetylmuramoyl-L-alanine amidase